jgi:hypothetical protein
MFKPGNTNFHERVSADGKIVVGGDRPFGFVFATAFLFFAWLAYPSLIWVIVLAGLSMGFALVAIIRPALLHPLNVVWMTFGHVMQRIVNPIVMGILFYLVITPFGAARRVFGKSPLDLKLEPDAKTYWRTIDRAEVQTQSMKNQY